MTSRHYGKDRKQREEIIKNIIGEGHVIRTMEVDKGHKNGTEIHKLTDTGIIEVYNKATGKLITKLIARCGQAKRFGYVPQEIWNKCYHNTVEMHYNEI